MSVVVDVAVSSIIGAISVAELALAHLSHCDITGVAVATNSAGIGGVRCASVPALDPVSAIQKAPSRTGTGGVIFASCVDDGTDVYCTWIYPSGRGLVSL